MRTETIVIPKAKIGASEAVWLEDKIISAGFVADHLIVDFTKVTSFSSAAIGIMIQYQKTFDKIVCLNLSAYIKGQWEALGLLDLWYYETTPEPAKTTEP